MTAETTRKIAKRPAAFPRVLATSAEKRRGHPATARPGRGNGAFLTLGPRVKD